VAVSGSLAVVPAAALELGDVKVHSTLGQPLRASISYALAPNEQLDDACVSIATGPSSSGLPAVRNGSVIVTNGVIAITGQGAMHEPLASMRVSIRCPYTPHLTREYMLFVDPSETLAAPVARSSADAAGDMAASRPASPAQRPVARATAAAAVSEPVAMAGRYRVQAGDTLSGIAQRIDNRPVGLWPAANAIFAANPDAFFDGDINKLKAGSWLSIPDFGSGATLTVSATEAAEPAPTEVAPAAVTYTPENLSEPAAPVEQEPVSILDPTFSATAPAEAGETAQATEDAAEDLRPGDIVTRPLATVPDDSIVIPDTELEGPAATSAEPNRPLAIIRTPEPAAEAGTNWLAWLIGGGIALISALLGFGWFRGRLGSSPIGPASAEAEPRRRTTDTQRVETIGDVDYDLDDDSPTAENLALDADLVTGSGFEEGSAVDVTEDFAFASTTSLDIELPEEMSSTPEQPETDVIPPLNIDTESILESEVLPEEGGDDYDMSVIMDATKMPNPEDVTEKDLEAIEVPDSEDSLITADYTVSQEADYKILEQDYQDELTATQRLNEEIRRAAEDLAASMGEDADEESREMSTATMHELDVTAQLQSQNDDDASGDDTGISPTVNLEAEDKTVEMTDDKTVEMPRRGKAG
jgi:murein DD-endopeptidase MepM/ murein hydrolase activator NlpD